jgi:hypothetical protein
MDHASAAIVSCLALSLLVFRQADAETRGYVEGSATALFNDPQFTDQTDRGVWPSAALRLETKQSITDTWQFTGVGFARLDTAASRKLHADVRDGYIGYFDADYEFRAGVFTEYWGYLEAKNLIDIINYRDLVEDFEGKTKLGQPGVTLGKLWENGRFDLYVLPYQRGNRIPEEEDRFRIAGLPLRSDDFEDGQWRPAVAARVMVSGDLGELFVSHFYGASREAQFDPVFGDSATPGVTALKPRYATINQTGIGAQAIVQGTNLKLEAFHRTGDGPAFVGFGVGFEHEIPEFLGTGASVSPFTEFYYDTRDENKSPRTAFDHDISFGARAALNDLNGTELLLKSTVDLETAGTVLTLEGSMQFNDITLALRADAFINAQDDPALAAFKDDNRLRLSVRWNF